MDLQKRLAKVAKIPLKHGSHASQKAIKEACVMEAVAWVAGEEWSDHPQCACPVIGAFMRSWNDSLPDDETRARLLRPLIPKLVGSRSTPNVESRRSWLALDWLARVHTPAFLELAGLKDHAQLCRELGELCDSASAKASNKILAAARAAARAAAWDAARAAAGAAAGAAARDAAGAAAWDAAGAAAGAAARDAARDAAGAAAGAAAWDAAWDAARAAAGAAARDAAWDAARAAAWDAARDAARAAAWDALDPTVKALQFSALELIDCMLLVTK